MSTPSWVARLKVCGPDAGTLLAHERANSSISVSGLSRFLFTQSRMDRQDRILAILKGENVFEKSQDYVHGRVELFESALARAKRLRQLRVEHGWSREDNLIAMELISEYGPYNMHFSMFTMTLRDHGTLAQHKLFLEPAENYEIIGCYAQTELGHGSNVRGLETTATWSAECKSFILHSPYLTSSKWWIGGLGRTANHVVLMAQLLVEGISYGPHTFVVQIRDMQTHEPLEGICVGDIGPKFGLNAIDNGYLLFNQVKIPHINMLAKFSRVDTESSQYVRLNSFSMVYSTMTYSRSTIVLESGSALGRAATIAVRYTAGRVQFPHHDAPQGSSETQVLDFTTVQYRLFPVIASSFALHFMGKHMMMLHAQATASVGTYRGEELLADLHGISCSLKVFASTITAEGIETCRRAMGGHGFSSFSGLTTWYADYLPTVTWEGDNYMLTQQVARYLLKSARSVLRGDKPSNDITETFAFFLQSRKLHRLFRIHSEDEDLVATFAQRTSFLAFKVLARLDEHKASWNSLLVDFQRLSTAYSQFLVVKYFYHGLCEPSLVLEVNGSTIELLRKLFRLFTLNMLEISGTEFQDCETITLDQLQHIREHSITGLLESIRPHAVPLVDAWNFPDWQLNSSLGRKYGMVYEDLFYRASQLNPLNDLTVDPNPYSKVIVKRDDRKKLESKL